MIEGVTRGAAVAPGHVTGLFEIHDKNPEKERRGSRGGGVCLEAGAVSLVEVEPADHQSIQVYLNKEASDAPVTTAAVNHVLQAALLDDKVGLNRDAPKGERAKARVTVHTDLHLPERQGFGMSAAGGLSAALALARALRVGRSEALRAAHLADLTERGGLGDVMAAAHGGFEVRTSPGLPPYGTVRRIVGTGELVLCVVGGEVSTKAVLTDPARRKKINEVGRRFVDDLVNAPSVENLFHLSNRFAQETGLLTPEAEAAIDSARAHGHAAMCMLGDSVFAIGRTEDLKDVLSQHGEVFVTHVAEDGARLLEIEGRPASAASK